MTRTPSGIKINKVRPQSTHRVAIAKYWRTSHHDGKSVLAGPPPFSLLPSRTKLQCTLLLRGPIHSIYFIYILYVRGASKIKLKKVNKKRTVTVRRVIIFLNISRRLLLICLYFCLHQYKTLKAGGDGDSGDNFADPCQEFKQGFLGVSSGLPLV